ncbi:MAG TPA: ferrous iron transport protein A [Spirochaetota bacterium]|nr:ferrous iron transport protein A [Spirochaetota bacterium]HOS34082.1 ferrous iron transport protein A [Spirochaetota bacterium]HOS55927.1 ferrous iron transport protein A [Spirochaetota bacterium]HPK62389.1 ferrous iron transport protein A [Spirochaetota bacterium]HQF77963.1 ferrous iron transport protein A [Spirochaetota bacterium]
MNKADTGFSYPLFLAKEFDEVSIVEIKGGQQFREKCINQGIVPGQKMTVLKKTENGPCLMSLFDSRIMIGREMLSRIFVKKA